MRDWSLTDLSLSDKIGLDIYGDCYLAFFAFAWFNSFFINFYLSSRNLGKVKVVTADSVNTFDVLNAKKVVMAESSIEVIEKILN